MSRVPTSARSSVIFCSELAEVIFLYQWMGIPGRNQIFPVVCPVKRIYRHLKSLLREDLSEQKTGRQMSGFSSFFSFPVNETDRIKLQVSTLGTVSVG